MKLRHALILSALSFPGMASGANILSTGDAIIAIGPLGSNSSFPGGEAPPNILDGDPNTKYLNFGGKGAGFIVTPAGGSSVIKSMSFTTAGDAPGRDPASYSLYGTTNPISSASNSNGLGEAWSLISNSSLSLPSDRLTGGTVADFTNLDAFTSYKLVFDSLRNQDDPIMQIADIQFYTGAGATGAGVLSPGAAVVAIDHGSLSRHGSEGPGNLLDGMSATKYLNFAGPGSGFIVTPASGPSIAKAFGITTAGDVPGRDPASYRIFGTNDAINSTDNGLGDGEAWTLIQNGSLSLPDGRETPGSDVALDNSTSYTSYKVVFDDVKASGNVFQIADFRLDTVPEPSSAMLTVLGGLALLKRRR